MAEKTIRTRIKLLVKSYSEWQAIKDSFVPMKGEVCIVNVPAAAGAVVQEPAVLFKVGDGVKKFSELAFSSALAADVYNWAKKASLDWADLSEDFKDELEEFIAEHAPQQDTLYRIVADGDYKWKLQKSVDEGETWVDATGAIDVSDLEARIAANEAAIAKKVDREMNSAEGKALIFNEADGGGAKFEHVDGTWSYVGVSNHGANGTAAQIYAVNKDTLEGVRLNVTKDGIFYMNGAKRAATADDELVVKGDIKDLAGALHFIGKTTVAAGETIAQAIARLLAEKSHVAVAGDVVILQTADSTKEYIYDGSAWLELGDENLYATKAALQAEEAARIADVNARKLEILPVSAYGFDTNLREKQIVDGSELVDTVISKTNDDLKQVIIKAGEFKFNVLSILNAAEGYRGFSVQGMIFDPTDENAEPIIEKGVFLYFEALDKTVTYFAQQYSNQMIDGFVAMVEEVLDQHMAKINAKVDKEIVTAAGKALIFNESDGGGAKFEKDGYASFVGVNQNVESGIGAQIYDIDVESNAGSKLDVTKNGMYYTKGADSALPASQRDVAANEIATKGDIIDSKAKVDNDTIKYNSNDELYASPVGVGQAGIAPAPAAEDASKVLKGTGAWGFVNVNELEQSTGDVLILDCNI